MLSTKLNNLSQSIESFQKRELFLKTFPSRAIIELTQNCNLKCKMCPQSWDAKYKNYNPQLNMKVETFEKIAQELFPNLIFADLRGFGETLLHPDINKILDIIASYDFIDWHLISNLTVFRKAIWSRLMELGFTVGFSCDGASPETFSKTRGGADLGKTLVNLEFLMGEIQKFRSGDVYFVTTLQLENVFELEDIVKLAKRHGVGEVAVKPILFSDQMDYKKASPDKLRAVVTSAVQTALSENVQIDFADQFLVGLLEPALIEETKKRRKFRISRFWNNPEISSFASQSGPLLDGFNEVAKNQRCWKPYSFTYINYRGDVGTCNHMMYPTFTKFGNLNQRSIFEIWNSPLYASFRNSLNTARPKDSRCQWCFANRSAD